MFLWWIAEHSVYLFYWMDKIALVAKFATEATSSIISSNFHFISFGLATGSFLFKWNKKLNKTNLGAQLPVITHVNWHPEYRAGWQVPIADSVVSWPSKIELTVRLVVFHVCSWRLSVNFMNINKINKNTSKCQLITVSLGSTVRFHAMAKFTKW